VARGVSQADSNGYLQSVVELTKVERDGKGAKNTDPDGKVTQLTGDELVSMNMWGFLPSIFPLLRERFHAFLERSGNDLKSEHYVPTAVNELVSSGQARVKVLRTNDAWFGVTYREDRPRVVDSIAALIKKGKYPEKLWN
jgi:hypothetical protein